MSEGTGANAPTGDSADDREQRWLREVYQGDDARQLTVRVVVLGMLLGGLMSCSNLIIALADRKFNAADVHRASNASSESGS